MANIQESMASTDMDLRERKVNEASFLLLCVSRKGIRKKGEEEN
jgi:hypothetical protein